MVARQGAKRQWHFAHKPPYERCADSDKALHDTAVAMIILGFSDALDRQTEYRLGCSCEQCGRTVHGCALGPGRDEPPAHVGGASPFPVRHGERHLGGSDIVPGRVVQTVAIELEPLRKLS